MKRRKLGRAQSNKIFKKGLSTREVNLLPIQSRGGSRF